MIKSIYAFSSAACNYLPKTRLLVQSLRRFHPEIKIVLTMADQPGNPELLENEHWDEILPIHDLGITDWHRWAFTHDIVELSTAIKPFALKKLLDRPDCQAVLYFDPDVVLFSRLDDLISRFCQADILLTPHQTKAENKLSEVMDNEICSLKHGIYNLGFLGVKPSASGHTFARWWTDRAYYFCRDEIPNGLFTDQRWIDLAPALFDGVHIVRSSRFNVAPWNLSTRRLSGDWETGFEVDGESLGFYHFTGFDSGAHRISTAKYETQNPSINLLTTWYENAILKVRDDPLVNQPWAYGCFDDGTPIHRVQRLIYRNRPDLQDRFLNPFAAPTDDNNTFAGWCQRNGPREYPGLLPVPTKEIDWSILTERLTPSIAPSREVYPGLRERLMMAASNSVQARLLARQTAILVRREGFSGLFSRLRRMMR